MMYKYIFQMDESILIARGMVKWSVFSFSFFGENGKCNSNFKHFQILKILEHVSSHMLTEF